MVTKYLTFFLPLFAGHILADFVFQSEVQGKPQPGLKDFIKHGLHIGLISFLLLGLPAAWWMILGLVATHLLLDLWAVRNARGSVPVRFLVDQGAHGLVLVVFSWAASAHRFQSAPIWWRAVFGMGYYQALVFLSGILGALWVGSAVVEHVFLSLAAIEGQGLPSGAQNQRETGPLTMGLAEGGKIIGYLERCLILVFVLAGHPAGIGFLIAAKSVFRFGELTDLNRRRQAEYIIIGTLTSILFGTLTAYLTALALRALQVPLPLLAPRG